MFLCTELQKQKQSTSDQIDLLKKAAKDTTNDTNEEKQPNDEDTKEPKPKPLVNSKYKKKMENKNNLNGKFSSLLEKIDKKIENSGATVAKSRELQIQENRRVANQKKSMEYKAKVMVWKYVYKQVFDNLPSETLNKFNKCIEGMGEDEESLKTIGAFVTAVEYMENKFPERVEGFMNGTISAQFS